MNAIIYVLLVLLFYPTQTQAEEKVAIADCPQCGIWQIGESPIRDSIGQYIYLDKRIITIPSCGRFEYQVAEHRIIPSEVSGDRFPEYKLELLLNARETLGCDKQLKKLSVRVSGFYQEGSIGDFNFQPEISSTNNVAIRAWNNDRENPCEVGSVLASADCSGMVQAESYRNLMRLTTEAFELFKRTKPEAKLPSFNTIRFATNVNNFCERNTDHVLPDIDCVTSRLSQKKFEVRYWKECIESNTTRLKCKFPDESFSQFTSKTD